jgi:hypothetical protein
MTKTFLDDLFSHLSAEGAELIFFIDGFIQSKKFQTWTFRQNRKYNKHIDIMDQIYHESSLKNIVDRHGSSFYTNTFLSVIEASCLEYGQLNYAVINECDQEIAEFASKNPRVLAVMSNDTDFLIFPGPWRYFSTKDLNSANLTLEFDRKGLQNLLKLNSFEMAILATISGNDFVSYDPTLRRFHEKFAFRTMTKFPALANYIKQQKFVKKNLIEIACCLEYEIYRTSQQTVNRIIASIRSYAIPKHEETVDRDLTVYLMQHHLFTFNVLNNSPINFSLVFYDLRQLDWPTYYDLSVPIFQRQAGIILQAAHSEIADRELTIYSKQTHLRKYSKFTESPIYPPFEVPSIEELYSNCTELDGIRFNLLKWLQFGKIIEIDFEDVPDDFMINILTICFMLRHKIINHKEADIFLWTIKNVENRMIPENIKPPTILDPRAFRLVFLFVRLYGNVARSIEVCGLKRRYGVR